MATATTQLGLRTMLLAWLSPKSFLLPSHTQMGALSQPLTNRLEVPH